MARRSYASTAPRAASHVPTQTLGRKRALAACLRCRRLKQSCDADRPCRRCVRAAEECEDDNYDEPRYSPDSASHSHSSVPAMPALLHSAHASRAASPVPVAALQKRLRVADGITISGQPLRTFVPALHDDLGNILAVFPSQDECRALLAKFLNFDLMFRVVHVPSFTRRAEAQIARLPHADTGDAPFLSLLTACFCTAVTVSTSPDRVAGERHMIALHEGLISFCENQGAYTIDYVQALVVNACARLGGGAASPATLFLELGRAYQAALLVGMYQDQPGETLFQREMRRRLWYQILIQRHLMADRLHIDSQLDVNVVPRPMIISDEVMDNMTTGVSSTPHVLTEWGYVDARAELVNLMLDRKKVMANERVPLPERWEAAEELIAQYLDRLPPHFRTAHSRGPGIPNWVHMQACVLEIGAHDLSTQLYHTYFSSRDPTIVSLALLKAVKAGHRLVDSTRALMTFILFDYVDAPSAGLWTYTMRAFTAGLLMAYYIMVVPTCPEGPSHIAALDAMVGVLRSSVSMGGSTTSNLEALKTLEMLRAKIRGTAADDDVVGVTDPYTGAAVALPFSIPIQNVLPGDWLEWDALFRDLFEGAPDAHNQVESMVVQCFEELG
ncbi:uncharacterized protein CcaverHIS019_0511340 [Cutaneotrichosporon cavernicola]|uniref:Zn(2)-C6 fungal-type domain-containing protein n=1 Tax=Cutaneotrichosporon cavernicola TaxID=279322 RepID=A0AA48L7V2_9TREE|nr:uncharacterized protein CcaverHIS019_0511340 [Cutaneotrichosporon cavernicola]BEI93506.1 hypothetical protein CcaverHIS019_0511340 [Cutaneotrichosporon cavernicola]BEJ01285.1 hypothetical protein CcaverHIS631_0511420 [Cutaneotrichosporon cavernicola]